MRVSFILGAACTALLLTACTQPAVNVTYKGQNSYGKGTNSAAFMGGSQSYMASSAPVVTREPELTHYSETANIPTVGVKDLSPVTVPSKEQARVESAPTTTSLRDYYEKPMTVASKPVEPAPIAQSVPQQQSKISINLSKEVSQKPEVSSKPQEQARVVVPEKKAMHKASSVAFVWPVEGGKVISHYGKKDGGAFNDGINIAAQEGEPIWAAADGMVVYAGNELKGYGNMVILRHDDGWMTAYAHAKDISVKKNDFVRQGDLVGYVGRTGGVKSAQLHFGIRAGKDPVDPEQYLPSQVAGM